MKRIALAGFSTMAALVVLFLYPTSTGHSGTTAAAPVSGAKVVSGGQPSVGSAGSGQGPDPAGTAGSAAGAATTAPAAASTTVDGAAEMTRYGVVQVEVVITDGKITEVTALKYPNTDGRDVQINSRALPMLRAQVIAAQSAKIDGVSGATFTSDGYVTSLQSALDAAGFKA